VGGVSRLHLRSVVSLAAVAPGNRLLADYLAGLPNARELFAVAPDALIDRLRTPATRADAARLSSALVAYQQHLGADEAAVENARLIAHADTAVVTVGQQPGLLTGPLYTPLKALAAIALARRLAREMGRSVVPVFWLGTDDDDVAEVDHCSLWDAAGGWRDLRLPDTGVPRGTLVGDLPLGEGAASVVSDAIAALAGLPHVTAVEALLRETLNGSIDFGEWCARLLARLLSRFGLVIVDPRLPALRALAAPIIRRELERPLQTTTLVNARAKALAEGGYPPALTKPDDVCNAFLQEKGRQRITFNGETFNIGDTPVAQSALLATLDAAPERFVPNAVLRPVCQESLFGSAAFVAGPNEVGYWAELAPVFATLGVAMPVVIPRSGVTLIPPRAARILEDAGVAPLDWLLTPEAVRRDLLTRAQPVEVTARFSAARAAVDALSTELRAAASAVDVTLAASAAATRQGMLGEIERLEKKVRKALERHDVELAGRFTWTREMLFPGGGLQERRLNLFAWLARCGVDALVDLLALLDGQESRHLFVEY
jgi:bacillithiol synthase